MKYLMCTLIPPAFMTLIGTVAGAETNQVLTVFVMCLFVSFLTTCLHAAWNSFSND